MQSTFLIESRNKNYYLFDKKLKEIKNLSKKEYEAFSKLEIDLNTKVEEVFRKKYTLLKENGFFDRIDTKKKFSGRLTLERVKYNLANLSQLVFEVTDRCNLNCTYCAYGHLYCDYDNRSNINLDFTEAKKIIDYIISCGQSKYAGLSSKPLTVSFYGGEPLLNMKFIEDTVEYIKASNINRPVKLSMTTNGLLLHKYFHYLVENNFSLLISLDGDEEGNSYRLFHNQKPAFSEIKRNIDLIANTYPQYFKEYVSFNAVLHDKNNVIEIIEYIKKTYSKIPRIAPLNDSGIREDAKQQFNEMFKNIDEKELVERKEYKDVCKDLFLNLPSFTTISNFFMQNTSIFKLNINDVLHEKENINYTPSGTCSPFSKKMFITVNKKVMFCERINQNYFAGYIDNIDEGLGKLVNSYNNYVEKLEKQCQNCYSNETCSLCMYYIDDLDKKPICRFITSKSGYQEHLQKVFTYLEQNEENIYRIKNEVVID